MGIYYSLYEWYHPLWKNKETQSRYVTEHLHPKFKEVVTRYKPWFIFLDGEWSADYRFWQSERLAAWLYNESPCKDYVITNDRWGRCRGIHGDVFESEYGGGDSCSPEHPWQEDRGMGHSYGYNRAESIADYDSAATMIQMLVRCTAGGGNYLLCVGPTADGRIPVIMQQRLVEIGNWLRIHGDAVYGAKASPFWPRRFDWGYISAKPGKLYLHTFDAEATKIELTGLRNRVTAASILEHPNDPRLEFEQDDDRFSLRWPAQLNNSAATVIALDIEGPPDVDRTQQQYADGRVVFGCRALNIHGAKAHVYYRGHGQTARIIEWTDPEETVSGTFDLLKPGRYQLRLTYSASPGVGASDFRDAQAAAVGSRLVVDLAGQQLDHTTVSTGGDERFKTIDLGEVQLDQAGRHIVTIRPRKEGWKGIGLQSLELVPATD
jgi:alpha-L-fucosidase